jgi:hypothetical protein
VTVATSGTVNTGGGGGGGGDSSGDGGAGGKGVVIVRHLSAFRDATTLTGGTMTKSGSHTIYTFNDSGTIGWS